MSFWSRLFGNKTNIYDDSLFEQEESVVCVLNLRGNRYFLSSFDMTLTSSDVHKQYFELHLSTKNGICSEIDDLANSHDKSISGEIKFYKSADSINEGSLFEMKFEDAKCTYNKKKYNSSGTINTLILAIPKLKMANDEFEILN